MDSYSGQYMQRLYMQQRSFPACLRASVYGGTTDSSIGGVGSGNRSEFPISSSISEPGNLTYIPYHPKYKKFIIRLTLDELQQVVLDSTNVVITDDMIMNLIENCEVYMIVRRNKVIGYYCCTKPWFNRIYFGSCILIPEVQNRGYGRQVLKHVEKESLNKGAYVLDAHVQITNKKALSFWLKQGFNVTGPPINGSLPISKSLYKRDLSARSNSEF